MQATNWGVPESAQAPKTPQEMAVAMNDSFDAVLSSNSGTARPTYAVQGTIWVDKVSSTIHNINYYDGANDIKIATYNPTTSLLTFINIPDAFISFAKLKADIFNAITVISVDTDDHFLVVDATDGATKQLALSDVINAASSPPPTGAIFAYGGGTAPTGYLICDGGEYSRTTYNDLYAVLLTTFGPGDGTSTFNVPDMRGRIAMGEGTGTSLTARTRGAKIGEENHALTGAETGPHTHSVTVPVESSGGSSRAHLMNGTGSGNSGIGTSSAGGGSPHNNIQPSLVTNFIIKY